MRLENFKGFEDFTVTFAGDAFLVGPNNAGKSTVIAALRAVANMIRIASRSRATDSLELDGFRQFGHNFIGEHVSVNEDNIRHENRERDTRLTALFDRDAQLQAIWPEDDYGGFFFILDNDVNLRQPADVRKVLPRMGLVPVLAPLSQNETSLTSDKYVRSNLDGRLASQHFRNQLELLKREESAVAGDRFSEFREFIRPWVSAELDLILLRTEYGSDRARFELLYDEPESSVRKEIFWVGDGMQIWLQILLHSSAYRTPRS